MRTHIDEYIRQRCAISILPFYSTHLRKSALGRIAFYLLVLSCKTDISSCNCITGNPNTAGKRNKLLPKLLCENENTIEIIIFSLTVIICVTMFVSLRLSIDLTLCVLAKNVWERLCLRRCELLPLTCNMHFSELSWQPC